MILIFLALIIAAALVAAFFYVSKIISSPPKGRAEDYLNRNVPNMVRQITKEIAEEGANIVDMLNKSRGEFAYTLIDIEKEIPNTVIENIKQVDGILKVRAL